MICPALDAVERLRRLAVTLQTGDADACWLAERLRRFFDAAERCKPSLDVALDLASGPGGVTWPEIERRKLRDGLLRAMADRHFPGQRPGPAAKALLVDWRRYARVRLDDERRRGESGAAAGTVDADLFELARLDGPPDERRVRDILAAAERHDGA